MSKFEGDQIAPGPLRARFGFTLPGALAWRELVDKLEAGNVDPHLAFDDFMQSLPVLLTLPPPPRCCVFVSYQRRDLSLALKLAKLVTLQGYDYWLDAHDPMLSYVVGGSPIGSPRREILIAAIIEIALLSSTHVIATHTANSKRSRWIPYELGRAKQRSVVSQQTAGWFEPGLTPASCGEYTYLAVETRSRADVVNWLNPSGPRLCSTGAKKWVRDDPGDLP